jgi:hypothetical protein
MSVSDPTSLRLCLRRAGFHPIPVEGKRPPLEKWQEKFDVSDDEIRLWPKSWHFAYSTGCLAKYEPGLDIDITIPEAANAVEALVREHFEERGDIYVRYGKPPKRLIPLRTDEPFTKMVRVFTAPDGSDQKIEILGDGQQYVVAGIHVSTGKPYSWFGGELADIKREALPYVRREDLERFLDAAEKLLIEDFSFVVKGTSGDENGELHESAEELRASSDRVAAMLAVIPNDDVHWDEWNRMAMATWAATNGSADGLAAFDAWSKKSAKYNARATAQKWATLFKSPPTRIGAGTLYYLATSASPDWEAEYHTRHNGGGAGQPASQPGTQPGAVTAHQIQIHWHGEVEARVRTWLIEDLLPETGAGLMSGQWGTYKTFTALDLAAAIAAGASFINFPVRRQGGTLFIAIEGASEVAIRYEAVLREKYPTMAQPAPFAWIEEAPSLLDKNALETLVAVAADVEAKLQKDFGLPLALIIVDTIVIAAGYRKEGQENDAAINAAIMKQLGRLSQRTKAFVIGVDHFGKVAETGTRGSSVKEANADVVLALLGDKSITGAVTNTRLATRKRRSGAAGLEFPFSVRPVEVPLADGRTEGTLVIDWGRQAQAASKPGKDDWRAPALRLLRQVLMNTLVDQGKDIKPFSDGPTVRAIDQEAVRSEFYKSYPAEGDEQARRAARQKAFRRAVLDAQGKSLIAIREINMVTYLWLVRREDEDAAGASPSGNPE